MWPDLTRLVLLATGGATAILALVLLWLDFNKRANRAFAALLALKGAAILVQQLPILGGDRTTAFTFAALPYLLIPLVPTAAYFASVFPRPRGPLGRPGGGWILLATVFALEVLYLLRHDLFWTVAHATPAHGALHAFGGYAYQDFGPLSLLLWGSFPAFGILGVLFMHDYTRSDSGTQRFSHFLVGAGFTLNALFDGARQTAGLVSILRDPAGYPFAPWGWGAAFLPALSLVPAVVAVALVVLHRFGDAPERRREQRLERRFHVAAALAALTGLAPFLLPGETGFFTGPLLPMALTVWRLALPVLVSYALLRYALFDVDVRVKATIKRGTVAAVFGAVFFFVSEGIEGLVSDAQGPLFGLGAAALLTVAIKPLERFGNRVAGTVMPEAVPARDVDGDRMELYRQQCQMVLEDGQVTSKERRLLDALAQTWGLTPERVHAVEAEVMAAGGTVPGGLGQARPT